MPAVARPSSPSNVWMRTLHESIAPKERSANVSPVSVHTVPVREVLPLIDALTAGLASSGYDEGEMFGYSVEKLEQSGVHLVGATVDGFVIGIGGIELADDGTAELKRFYVAPNTAEVVPRQQS